jgi:hypothetical protein
MYGQMIRKTGMVVSLLSMVLMTGALVSPATAQHAQHGDHGSQGDKTGEVTLRGEILDMYCFMKHPENGQGPDHAKCAANCIQKGLPVGFLSEDGTVYLIIGKDHDSVNEMVVEYAGKQAMLTGTVVEHHGVKAIELESIAAAM